MYINSCTIVTGHSHLRLSNTQTALVSTTNSLSKRGIQLSRSICHYKNTKTQTADVKTSPVKTNREAPSPAQPTTQPSHPFYIPPNPNPLHHQHPPLQSLPHKQPHGPVVVIKPGCSVPTPKPSPSEAMSSKPPKVKALSQLWLFVPPRLTSRGRAFVAFFFSYEQSPDNDNDTVTTFTSPRQHSRERRRRTTLKPHSITNTITRKIYARYPKLAVGYDIKTHTHPTTTT